jgi:hypothetical protein
MEQGSKPVERWRPSLSAYITYLLGSGSSNSAQELVRAVVGCALLRGLLAVLQPGLRILPFVLCISSAASRRPQSGRDVAYVHRLRLLASRLCEVGARPEDPLPGDDPCLRATRAGRARERRTPYGHVAVAVRRSRRRKHRVHRRVLSDRHSTAPALVERFGRLVLGDITGPRTRLSGQVQGNHYEPVRHVPGTIQRKSSVAGRLGSTLPLELSG